MLALAIAVLPALALGEPHTVRRGSDEANSVSLMEGFDLSWTVDGDEQLTLTMRVETEGWIGFGIGEEMSGSMPNNDVVVVSTGPGGDFELTDRYTLGFFEPLQDEIQDDNWELVSRTVESGVTTLVVTRPMYQPACNRQDRNIEKGPVSVIAAYGETGFLSYHFDRRVAATVIFVSAEDVEYIGEDDFPEPDDVVDSYDFSFEAFEFPAEDTAYYCQSHELPFETDVHIIGGEVIWDGDERGLGKVHHMLAYACRLDGPDSQYGLFEEFGRCDLEVGGLGCTEIVVGSGPGQAPSRYPPEAGFRAGPGGSTKILLEFHIDNPSLESGIVAAPGVRFYYTEQLRQFDAGTMSIGDVGLSHTPLPPGEEFVHRESICPSSCTRRWDWPITVFGVSLHMHQAGRQMWNSVHRGGHGPSFELGRADAYSFDLQKGISLETLVTLYPGDSINVHSVFSTVGRTEPTNFDEASSDEMSISFISYYPKLPRDSVCGRGASVLSVCGDASKLSDVIFGLNPSPRDAEGTRDAEIQFGQAPFCDEQADWGTVSGTVFFDANGNGVRDDDEDVAPDAYVRALVVEADFDDNDVFFADTTGHYETRLPPGLYQIGARNLRGSDQGVVDVDLNSADAVVVDVPLVPRA